MSPDRAALELCGLAKSFGTTRVLSDVGLSVGAGSVVALLGPSGCGKTTLVRLVAGFERADSGEVVLAGNVVEGRGRHEPPERRNVGVVPQEGALFSHLDVAGNVGFGLPRRGRTRPGRIRVQRMLELVGLGDYAGRRPDQLSGGQQQRVAVARALAPNPHLVCLDEPFSSLDESLRASVRESVMGALRAERASVLMVTHDQDEALSSADQVAVMLEGRIAQVGAPDEVYTRPESAAVARFVGAAVLLPGSADGDRVTCELGTLELARPAWGPVTVLLRPEQVVPEPATQGESAREPSAEVISLSFHGHDALIGLRSAAGTPLQSRVWSGWLPRIGDAVALHVRGTAWPLGG